MAEAPTPPPPDAQGQARGPESTPPAPKSPAGEPVSMAFGHPMPSEEFMQRLRDEPEGLPRLGDAPLSPERRARAEQAVREDFGGPEQESGGQNPPPNPKSK